MCCLPGNGRRIHVDGSYVRHDGDSLITALKQGDNLYTDNTTANGMTNKDQKSDRVEAITRQMSFRLLGFYNIE